MNAAANMSQQCGNYVSENQLIEFYGKTPIERNLSKYNALKNILTELTVLVIYCMDIASVTINIALYNMI